MADFTQREIDDVRTRAEILAAKANHALRVANTANNVAGRQGCLIIVRAALAELEGLSRRYPFLSATNLSGFNRSIVKVENETKHMELAQKSLRQQQLTSNFQSSDPFLKAPLKDQVRQLGLQLETLKLQRIEKGWAFGDRKYKKPEEAALAHFKKLGFVGTMCEGAAPLMIMKCAALQLLEKINVMGPDAACTNYFEAQCELYCGFAPDILEKIRTSTEATVCGNFRKVMSQRSYSKLYPVMDENALLEIWKAITPERLADLAQAFMRDPYQYRAGWPDLTLVKDRAVRFVEIKTTDRFHASQKKLITDILKPLGASVSVMQVKSS